MSVANQLPSTVQPSNRDPTCRADFSKATFQALNIEYDNISEIEVDDTKELQIEEALKLYQTALKLHAEGSSSYDAAADAYRALLESDVFKWPESLTEFRRSEGLIEEDEIFVDAQVAAGPQPVISNPEAAPNTLPQILHLAYKNYGLFLMEVLQHKIKHNADRYNEITGVASRESLALFAQAIDKDDADVDLWRTSSAVAKLVGSTRISRFCLEAVLDRDEEGLDGMLSLPSIDESFAVQKLRQITGELDDDLAAPAALTRNGKIRQLAPRLIQRLEAFPDIPRPAFQTITYAEPIKSDQEPARHVSSLSRRSWSAVGEAIVMQLIMADSSLADPHPGAALAFDLPAVIDEGPSMIEVTLRPSSKPSKPERDPIAITLADSVNLANESTLDIDMKDKADQTNTSAAEEAANPKENTETPPEPALDSSTVHVDGSSNSRKRSTDEAELPEVPESGRLRSKRSKRNRETLDGTANDVLDANRQFELAMSQYVDADEILFDTMQHIFKPFSINSMGTALTLRRTVAGELGHSSEPREPLYAAILDLFEISQNCTPERAKVFSNGDNLDALAGTPIEYSLQATTGKKKFPIDSCHAHPIDNTQALDAWVTTINGKWTFANEAAWQWLMVLVRRGKAPTLTPTNSSSYLIHKWDEALKKSVVQIMVHADEYITARVQQELEAIEDDLLTSHRNFSVWGEEDEATIELVQNLFELHLDVYKKFKHPSSGIDLATLSAQRHRLEHWSTLAQTAVNLRSRKNSSLQFDSIALRHLWAVAFQISTLDDVSQTHILAVMHDLKHLLHSLDVTAIYLLNNAVMPEISVAAIDQELSDMSMQIFFQKVFSYNQEDPVAVIDSLEPILELQIHDPTKGRAHTKSDQAETESRNSREASIDSRIDDSLNVAHASSPVIEVSRFLSKASASLRLSLWQRLRMAYQAIEYQPKVVYCHLQSIILIVTEITSPTYVELDKASRALPLLHYLSLIEELIRRITEIQKSSSNAFDFVDEGMLIKALSALQSVSRLLTIFNIYEDCVRVGQLPAPMVDNRPKAAFHTIANKMYDLQVRNWLLQYSFLKEAIEQRPEDFTSPKQDRLNFIRVVHQTMGLRGVCNSADKALLKIARDELLQLSDLDDFESELGQVLFDLYGLKCTNSAVLQNHRCPEAETITRSRALKLLGFIMAQASKIPLKDLHRTDLRLAIEKVHGFLTMQKPKGSNETDMNRRLIKVYLRSPIKPADLFASLRGTLELATRPVPEIAAPIAAKGWFSLMANLALGRFRASRRNAPGSTEDLNAAIAFFLQDLEFSAERWESWYSLAQCYDLQIEEAVSWTAEKLNGQFLAQPKDSSHEIVQSQRAAIHSYAMAVSITARRAPAGTDTRNKFAELFNDFAMRLYASSREPFTMQAFAFRETEEVFLSSHKLHKKPPAHAITTHAVWKLSAALFKRSISLNPDNWHTHYMLAKCFWKLVCNAKDAAGEFYSRPGKSYKAPVLSDIVGLLQTSIKCLPDRKGREPILEPLYKLVSVLYKAVMTRRITMIEFVVKQEWLQSTTNIPVPKRLGDTVDSGCTPQDDDYKAFSVWVLEIIKELKAADKSNWQHRIISRAAHLRYSLKDDVMDKATAVKEELTQQMFTRTMIIQAWRPENERPGRHFVYTSRYLKYFSEILIELKDRPNLEQLIRRLRRKPNDFFNHTELWAGTVQAYLKMLREIVGAPSGYEETVFKSVTLEDFLDRAALLEKWAHSSTTVSTELDVLRETIELKRMNLGLMKPTLIDDLICDTYARLYKIEIERLLQEDAKIQKVVEMEDTLMEDAQPVQHVANSIDSLVPKSAPAGVFPGNLAPNTVGSNEDQSTAATSKPIKIKGVGRRDIMRKAEQVINRPVAATIAAIPPKVPSTSTPGSHPQIITHRRPSSTINLEKSRRSATVDRAQSAQRTPSVPPEVDDDSDSELSELDEAVVKDAERKAFMPLFPRLKTKPVEGSVTEGSHMDVDTEIEHDGGKINDMEDGSHDDEDEDVANEGGDEDEPDDEGEGDNEVEEAEIEDEEEHEAEDEEEADDEEEDDQDQDINQTEEEDRHRIPRTPDSERPKSQGFMTVQQGQTVRRTAPVDDSQEPEYDGHLSEYDRIDSLPEAERLQFLRNMSTHDRLNMLLNKLPEADRPEFPKDMSTLSRLNMVHKLLPQTDQWEFLAHLSMRDRIEMQLNLIPEADWPEFDEDMPEHGRLAMVFQLIPVAERRRMGGYSYWGGASDLPTDDDEEAEVEEEDVSESSDSNDRLVEEDR